MPNSLRLTAPAKINLFLEVLSRGADGYHNISTLFQEISLADELAVKTSPRPGCRLQCQCADLSAGPDNLVARAARAFQEKFPSSPGFDVRLKKNIPLGAGLGGGSSDAAAMLKACWGLSAKKNAPKFPWKSFVPLARGLGADVSFFLKGGLAQGEGRGDRITPVGNSAKNKKPQWFVLAYPRLHVSTPWVYKNLRFPLTKRKPIHRLREAVSRGRPCTEWTSFLYNRLEEVVLPRVPLVSNLKKALIWAGCSNALMSGSGSSVFGVSESESTAKETVKRLRREKWDLWVVHSAVD